MSIGLGDSPELAVLGEAIGLLDASGNLDPDWFGQPLTRLAQAVATPQQRDALVRFVNLALPPVPEPGRPAGETWHPLLGTQDRGDLYLTLDDTATGLVLGVAGDVHTGDGAPVPASLWIQGDLIAAGGSLDVVAGTTAHPLTAELRVQTGWAFAPPARPIGLQAVTGRFTIVPDPDHPSVSMQLVLEQLSLGGEPPADTVMDVEELGAQAPILLAALLKVVFAEADPDPVLTRLADHLLALLGLDGPGGVPVFPFAALGSGPAAIQAWMRDVLGAGDVPASAGDWLEHLAGMLGADVAATGDGTADAPWRATLASIGGGEVYATLALADGRLRLVSRSWVFSSPRESCFVSDPGLVVTRPLARGLLVAWVIRGWSRWCCLMPSGGRWRTGRSGGRPRRGWRCGRGSSWPARTAGPILPSPRGWASTGPQLGSGGPASWPGGWTGWAMSPALGCRAPSAMPRWRRWWCGRWKRSPKPPRTGPGGSWPSGWGSRRPACTASGGRSGCSRGGPRTSRSPRTRC